jgi:hypothetical protein
MGAWCETGNGYATIKKMKKRVHKHRQAVSSWEHNAIK